MILSILIYVIIGNQVSSSKKERKKKECSAIYQVKDKKILKEKNNLLLGWVLIRFIMQILEYH